MKLFLPLWDLHGDFIFPQPHTKWQSKMANHVNISQIFILNLTCMWFLADANAAEVKLIKF